MPALSHDEFHVIVYHYTKHSQKCACEGTGLEVTRLYGNEDPGPRSNGNKNIMRQTGNFGHLKVLIKLPNLLVSKNRFKNFTNDMLLNTAALAKGHFTCYFVFGRGVQSYPSR